MKTIFISDLHLSAERLDLHHAFEQFVCGLSDEVEALYVLGDLFDAWLGDDDPSGFAQQIKACLRSLPEHRIRLHIQRGNRDFLLGPRFCRETGAELLANRHLFSSHGQRALLMHGDLLCTGDRAYQRFRRRVQSPLGRLALRNLPFTVRQKIARRWRRQSQELSANKPENIMDVTPEAVAQCMREAGVSTLIHGHTHRPATHSLPDGKQRMVLGDWGPRLWWAEASTTGFTLHSAALKAAAQAAP
ncbi:MAG: UDP-2,3-diacylglucosamine diphosphatase [Cellvibrionales bacterium]|nr:UDP-2,3-diacylglucosamine diphosphatase [Cellvibrionales bacterium]